MADISDIEQALVDLVSQVVYPAGTGQPSALPGAAAVIVHRGWPLPNDLDRDLPLGKSHVSVWPKGGTERNITKYPVDWQETHRDTPSWTASSQNNTLTIAGAPNIAIVQFVTVQIGPRFVCSYAPVNGDTVASVAAAIAALISAGFATAMAVGGVVTVQSGSPIRTIVGVTGTQIAEFKRQVTQLQITLWCPSPAIRDALGKLVDPVLAGTTFLAMPDTTGARLRYSMTIMSDVSDKEKAYRRDIIYDVEYATTQSDTATEVTVVVLNGEGSDGNLGIAPPTQTYAPTPPQPVTQFIGRGAPYKPLTPN